jgi:hypothetical protein
MDPDVARQRRAQRRAKPVVIVNHEKENEQFTCSAPVHETVTPDHVSPPTPAIAKTEPPPPTPRIEASPLVLPPSAAPPFFSKSRSYVAFFLLAFVVGLIDLNYIFLGLVLIDFSFFFLFGQVIRQGRWTPIWVIGAVLEYYGGVSKRYPPYVILIVVGRFVRNHWCSQ